VGCSICVDACLSFFPRAWCDVCCCQDALKELGRWGEQCASKILENPATWSDGAMTGGAITCEWVNEGSERGLPFDFCVSGPGTGLGGQAFVEVRRCRKAAGLGCALW
jgi:hypothetical protein